jgi:hypothetical protein
MTLIDIGSSGSGYASVSLSNIRLQQDISSTTNIEISNLTQARLNINNCSIISTGSNSPNISFETVTTTTLNIRSSYIAAMVDTTSNVVAITNVGTFYNSSRNSVFYLDPVGDSEAHFTLDSAGSSNNFWLTMSDLTFYSTIKSTYMIFNNAASGNCKIDAISPLIGTALTFGSNGATMVDTVSGGWIIGNVDINDQAIFDR